MKYFCKQCGKTTQYNFELPKFCSFCGESFSKIQDSKQDSFNINKLKLNENINEPDVDNHLENVDFKKIKPSFKINIYQNKGESFGSLIDNPSKPIETKDNYSNNNIKTKDQILEEFKKEAGLSRSQD